jgi:hypothetical protein
MQQKQPQPIRVARVRVLAVVIVLLGVTSVRAQIVGFAKDSTDLRDAQRARIGLTARTYQDSIVLRWAPSKPVLFQFGIRSGYVIERAPVGADNKAENFVAIATSTILPWSQDRWEQYFAHRPEMQDTGMIDYDGIAYSMLYDSVSPTLKVENGAGDVADIQQKKSAFDMKFGIAMIAADRSSAAAEGLGLRFVDRGVKANTAYAYRVRLLGDTKTYTVEAGTLIVSNVRFVAAIYHTDLRTLEGEKSILLTWPINPKLGSYFVDRSDDNGKSYHRLNKIPTVTLRPAAMIVSDSEAHFDTGLVNYKVYFYRIYGTTSFADEALVGEIKAMPRDRTPPEAPFLPNPKPFGKHSIKLVWEMHDPVAKDLAGFNILRDTSENGEFVRLNKKPLLPNEREYLDDAFETELPNYYAVEAVDTAGNVSRSFPAFTPMPDSIPPAMPKWISGKMDTNGIVTLTVKANNERDFMGYRLLRSNSMEHEFAAVHETFAPQTGDFEMRIGRDTILNDTVQVRSLTPYVYYRAVALDQSFNESNPSEIIAVARPDKVPPVPPVITGVNVTDSSVTLEFVPSSSLDVKTHTLFRRIATDKPGAWDSILQVSGKARVALDRSVTKSILYEFTLRATDSAGNLSAYSGSISAKAYETGVCPAITKLVGSYDSVKKQIMLNWEYADRGAGLRYIIYRSIRGKGLQQYALVKEGKTHTFSDRELWGAGNYEYAVKVELSTGAESKLSEKASIGIR